MGNELAISLIILFSFFNSHAQCDLGTFVVEQCDMENVDFDSDTNPDGIINLYAESGIVAQVGDEWESVGTEPASFALDPTSGNLRLWKLRNASNQYLFELRNSSCTTRRAFVNLVLGPYAGVPATTGFFPVCDENDECADGIEVDIDLFDTLESREGEALPHLNGVWQYTGSLPMTDYILEGSIFGATIENNGGFPIDSEDFTFTYTVGGVGTCATESVDVKITLVRPVFAGFPSEYNICESDIDTWDRTINLRDDEYLLQEDSDGEWTVDNDQITSASDSEINLKDVYDAFLASPSYFRGFGCVSFSYTYTVTSRSPICPDSQATIVFRIFEELRQFTQPDSPEEICPATDSRQELDLFSLIEFQPGFEYRDGLEDEDFVFWTFESGPAGGTDLNLQENLDNGSPSEKHKGTIDIGSAIPGRYQFRYTVVPNTLCTAFGDEVIYGGDICSPSIRSFNPCSLVSTIVTIDVLEFDYAGENTSGINLCETEGDGQISLRGLLNSNGNTIVEGVWTDNNNGNVVVGDNLDISNIAGSSQDFQFTHTTSNASGCPDIAVLEFTVFREPNAGEDATVSVCTDDLRVTLFEALGGNPDDTGTWFGPFGYVTTDNVGEFNPDDDTLPILGPGEYVYNVPGNEGCLTANQAVVTIILVDPVETGENINETYCKQDGRVNLFSLLNRDTPRTGVFEDTDNTGALSAEGVLEFETLTNEIYNFRYVLANAAPCDESSLTVSIQIIDLPEPNVPDQEFCILDAARLEDIEVDVLNYNWYNTLESETSIVDNPLLQDNQVFYIATVDADGCESERVQVSINILNTGERSSAGQICTLDFQDGISPNGDNQNDTFDLFIEGVYNIPDAFPDFELKIYNRYGSPVYEGNVNTEEFRGESNTSVRLGDDLPSGTYYYIFTPNFENNLPIQGSFYLSR
ncbi:hypothetical protein GCM10022258_10140 [Aquimarina gracilis]